MFLDWLLASTPILLILVVMVRFRWGAAKAGPAAWLLTLIIAVGRFGAGLDLLALALAKALLLTLDVLLIVWAAFLLYRVADEAGAIEMLGAALPQWTADRGMQAILIGWAFTSFLQGVGGFGVPVAVTAPLLVGLGFSPLAAVVIPSIGHAWSVSFGSLATSFQALIAATDVPGETLALPVALLLGMAGGLGGFMVVHAAGGLRAVRRLVLPVVVLSLAMGSVQLALATQGLWAIAGFGGGMAGLAVGFLLASRYHGDQPSQSFQAVSRRDLWMSISGYIALVAITLLVQLNQPVRTALSAVEIRVFFPQLETARGVITPAGYGRVIPLLRHAGAILIYASLIAYGIYRRAGYYLPGSTQRILAGTVTRVIPSSLGIASMVGMAVIMSHAGMTDVLATGMAQGVGAVFPLVSPWIGAMGAFITGSNTNSNVLFAMLQQRTAELLAFSVPWVLAAQSAGGAIGSVFAPTKIAVGASTAGMVDKEGLILRSLLAYIAILLLAIGAAAWVIVKWVLQ